MLEGLLMKDHHVTHGQVDRTVPRNGPELAAADLDVDLTAACCHRFVRAPSSRVDLPQRRHPRSRGTGSPCSPRCEQCAAQRGKPPECNYILVTKSWRSSRSGRARISVPSVSKVL